MHYGRVPGQKEAARLEAPNVPQTLHRRGPLQRKERGRREREARLSARAVEKDAGKEAQDGKANGAWPGARQIRGPSALLTTTLMRSARALAAWSTVARYASRTTQCTCMARKERTTRRSPELRKGRSHGQWGRMMRQVCARALIQFLIVPQKGQHLSLATVNLMLQYPTASNNRIRIARLGFCVVVQGHSTQPWARRKGARA